jgi:hypothetical protein
MMQSLVHKTNSFEAQNYKNRGQNYKVANSKQYNSNNDKEMLMLFVAGFCWLYNLRLDTLFCSFYALSSL